jgi:hypothetical protein
MKSGFSKSPLILTNADFDGVDMRTEKIDRPHEVEESPSFRGMSLVNAMLDDNHIQKGDFAFTRLIGASFRDSEVSISTFYSADLRNSTFQGANVVACDFTGANLLGSDLTQKQLNDVTFLKDAILPDGSKGVQPNLIYLEHNGSFISTSHPQAHFDRVWSIYRDAVEDTNARISFTADNSHGLPEGKYEAYAKYRIILASTQPHNMIPKYSTWTPSNQLIMRVKGRCTAKGTNTSVSFKMHLSQSFTAPMSILFGEYSVIFDCSQSKPMKIRLQIRTTFLASLHFKDFPGYSAERIGFDFKRYVAIELIP